MQPFGLHLVAQWSLTLPTDDCPLDTVQWGIFHVTQLGPGFPHSKDSQDLVVNLLLVYVKGTV